MVEDLDSERPGKGKSYHCNLGLQRLQMRNFGMAISTGMTLD